MSQTDPDTLSQPLGLPDLTRERTSIVEGLLDYVRTLRASRNPKLAAAAIELECELSTRLATLTRPGGLAA